MRAEGGTVHVIDDDEAIRDSLSFLLDSAGIPAVMHESAVGFLREVPELAGCCVITDVRMPEMSGMDLLRELGHRGLDVPVIMITGHADVPLAVNAMRSGAFDFIEKPFDDAVVLASVRAALARQQALVRADTEKAEIRARIAALSARERQVMVLLVAGNPNKTIAYDLGISPRTVEIYRANLMTKMQAATLSDLVRMALIGTIFDEGAGAG